MLDMLSVLLETVSARCVRVRVGLGLGLEHEDPGCSRGAERADGSITRHVAGTVHRLAPRRTRLKGSRPRVARTGAHMPRASHGLGHTDQV